jgi:cysteine desulfurase/selenocysteine lyase
MDEHVRREFPVTDSLVYLNSAALGPSPLCVRRCGEEFIRRQSLGLAGSAEDWIDMMNRVRETLARFIGAAGEEIAFTRNTSEGTNLVAGSLDFDARHNVVGDDLDHPSNRMIWNYYARQKGFEYRVVPSRQGALTVEDFERRVDRNTRIISVSLVSFRNGFRHDAAALADLAHARGALLLVDAIQGLGALSFDVRTAGIDFLTCGAYKWLLGTIGLGFFYARADLLERIRPLERGWMQVEEWDSLTGGEPGLYRSARKVESGTLNFQGVAELGEIIAYLEKIGLPTVEEHILSLRARLYDGLAALGFELTTPRSARSGIVTCLAKDAVRMEKELRARGIVVTARNGQIRFSPHLFNNLEDIDRALAAMKDLCGETGEGG